MQDKFGGEQVNDRKRECAYLKSPISVEISNQKPATVFSLAHRNSNLHVIRFEMFGMPCLSACPGETILSGGAARSKVRFKLPVSEAKVDPTSPDFVSVHHEGSAATFFELLRHSGYPLRGQLRNAPLVPGSSGP